MLTTLTPLQDDLPGYDLSTHGHFISSRRRFATLLGLALLSLAAALGVVFALAAHSDWSFAAPWVFYCALILAATAATSAAVGLAGACLNSGDLLTLFTRASAALAAAGALAAAAALNISEQSVAANAEKHFAPDAPAPEVMEESVRAVRSVAAAMLAAVAILVRIPVL